MTATESRPSVHTIDGVELTPKDVHLDLPKKFDTEEAFDEMVKKRRERSK